MIDLRTPVAASRKSSSSNTKPLARIKEETKPYKMSREQQPSPSLFPMFTSVTLQASRKSVLLTTIENYLEIDWFYDWSMATRTTFLTNGNRDYILPANNM